MSILSAVPWGLLVPSGVLVAFSFVGAGNAPPPPLNSPAYSWDLLHRHQGEARGPYATGEIFWDVDQRDSTVIAVAPNGSIRSADGGVTWKDLPGIRFVLGVALSDSGLVLAGGRNGEFRRSVDDGVTWTEVKTDADGFHTRITMAGDTAFAVAKDAVIRTVDGGMSWRRSPLPIQFGSIARAGPVVIAIGGAGLVARSADLGETWETRWLPGTELINGVAFADHRTAVIVGAGILLRTTDAGLTWTPVRSPARAPIRSIAFTSATEGLGVGLWGEAIRTADGGATWEREASGTPYHLTSVRARPGSGFVVSGMRETVFSVTARAGQ